jgi:thiamine-monophosphate kinase
VGDRILVSGTLGDSRGGLETLLQPLPVDDRVQYLQQRFYRPEPRIELARRLRPHVHAGLDISDGLLADLNHLLEASGVGAEIERDRVPCSDALRQTYPQQAVDWALSGGEDFELCLSVAAEQAGACIAAAQTLGIGLTEVGRITAERGLRVLDAEGRVIEGLAQGYDHFKEST